MNILKSYRLYTNSLKSAVLEAYNGTALKRLIETRWSGHYDSTNHVNQNYKDLIHALRLASNNKKLKSEERALALGLLHQMMEYREDEHFVFINCMLMQVLKPINIVVKQLQSSSENLSSAVINRAREELTSIRKELSEEKVEKMVSDFLELADVSTPHQRRRRATYLPSRFDEFIVTENIPSKNNRSNLSIFAECLDLFESEFER